MKQFKVYYETPATRYNSEMTYSDIVKAKTIAEAVEKSVEKHVKLGKITLTGIDLTDSFHGLDRDVYEMKNGDADEFKEKVTSLIKSVEVHK